MSWHAMNRQGQQVKPRQVIEDFRGKPWVFVRVSRPPIIGSTGRVEVEDFDTGLRREFFPSVFDLALKEG